MPFFPAFQSALLPTFLLKLLRDRHQCLLILWQTAGQPAEKHARLGRITVLQHIVKQHSQLPTVSVSQHHNGRQRLRYAAEIALANMFCISSSKATRRCCTMSSSGITVTSINGNGQPYSVFASCGSANSSSQLREKDTDWLHRDKKHRHHQRQRFVPGIRVALHCGNRIAHQAKGHMAIR